MTVFAGLRKAALVVTLAGLSLAAAPAIPHVLSRIGDAFESEVDAG